ncbi:hypothetical protein Gohar_021959, partial [Gossypium harknessii]|nr:hypothetical protein [Gossypium harknessii]
AKVFSRFESLQKAVKHYTIEATPDETSSVVQQGGMFVFKGKNNCYMLIKMKEEAIMHL